jgi:hypothetical protein
LFPALDRAERKEIEDSRIPIYLNNKCRELKHPLGVFSEGASMRGEMNAALAEERGV